MLIFRNKLVLLFITFIVTYTGLITTMVIILVQTISQCILFTDLNSLRIVTFLFQESIQNNPVTGEIGIIVLLISHLILFLLIYAVQSIADQQAHRIGRPQGHLHTSYSFHCL